MWLLVRGAWAVGPGECRCPLPTAGQVFRSRARDAETIVFFAGAIKGQSVDGVLRTLTDDDNRVADITLMVRPWAALKAGIADINI